MAEYAYISKDKSYALKHYGVKGMKWHKHLKRSFDDKIGLTAKRAYDRNSARMRRTGDYDDGFRAGVSYTKYSHSPLGRLASGSKTGEKIADAYDRTDRSIDVALRKRNVKKRIKNEEKKKLNALLEKGRANAAKEKISTSSPLIERAKEKKRQISERKTRIPGVTENGYIKEPQTIRGSRKRRRRR